VVVAPPCDRVANSLSRAKLRTTLLRATRVTPERAQGSMISRFSVKPYEPISCGLVIDVPSLGMLVRCVEAVLLEERCREHVLPPQIHGRSCIGVRLCCSDSCGQTYSRSLSRDVRAAGTFYRRRSTEAHALACASATATRAGKRTRAGAVSFTLAGYLQDRPREGQHRLSLLGSVDVDVAANARDRTRICRRRCRSDCTRPNSNV
jgi:hypothetical protein